MSLWPDKVKVAGQIPAKVNELVTNQIVEYINVVIKLDVIEMIA